MAEAELLDLQVPSEAPPAPAAGAAPARIFVSYTHVDQPFVLRLVEALPPLGVVPWFDRDGIHSGARWSSVIQEALDDCDALLLVLTPEAMASGNVEDEWQYVLDQGKPVVPLLLSPTKVHFQLGRLQHVDFHAQPFEVALAQLVQGIGRVLAARGEGGWAAGREGRRLGPPSGTVTFLFTDIAGSTALWEEHTEVMDAVLAHHDRLLRRAIAGHHGHVFKTVGDAFCTAFRSAGDALAAAIDIQRAIAAEPWSERAVGFPELRVRIALHTGEAREREGDYFGPPLNRVARLTAVARGAQVLLSGATARLVREHLPEGALLRDQGEHRLRDLRHSEHIHQLLAPGLPPAPRTVRDTASGAAHDDPPPTAAEAITPRRLRRALSAIRTGRVVEDEGLLDLGLLRARLPEVGLGQTPEARSRLLAELLHERIAARLAILRGLHPPDLAQEGGRAAIIAGLRADFGVGEEERECWSVLWLRFVCPLHIRLTELPEVLAIERGALRRRLKAGLYALAVDLREQEAALIPRAETARRAAGGKAEGNLPAPRDRFVGRDDDLAAVAQRLTSSRLVTLIGPGGVGKTRLALEAGRRWAAARSEEVWLLELAGLQEREQVLQALAALWQVAESEQAPLLDGIQRRLRGRATLLLLDNCEHLLDACAELADGLLDRCPELRILATSRAALEIAGETRWRLAALPGPAPTAPVEAAALSEAERLIVARLRERRPGLPLDEADRAAVRRICQRLDGLPLALELAAARAGAIPLPVLADMIEAEPERVRGGRRGRPRRHRSVHDAIAWSYGLLTPRQRWAFECLSAFAGGFDLEAAEAVCAGRQGGGGPTIERYDVLDLLSGLVEQSLLAPPELAGAQLRYRMLQSLRAFAGQRAARRGVEVRSELALRHARHFQRLALAAGEALSDAHHSDWLHRLDRERENLLAAIHTFRRHGRVAEALAMAAAMRHYWSMKGALSEGRRLLETLLAAVPSPAAESGLEPAVHLDALEGAGHLARRQCDYVSARERLGAGLALARELGERGAQARLLRLLGHVADEEGRYDEAQGLYREALAICREREDGWGEAALLNNLGLLELNQGRIARATLLLDESLAAFRALDERWAVGVVLLNRGNARFDDGDPAAAARCYAESLAIAEELGDRAGIAAALSALAKVAMRDRAFARAATCYRRSMRELRDLGDAQKIAEWLEAHAHLDHARGRAARACRLLAAAEALRERIGAPLLAKADAEHAALHAALQQALGEARYDEMRAAGARLAWRESVEEAIS